MNTYKFFVLFLVIVVPLHLKSQIIFDKPLSERVTEYKIDVKLDAVSKMLRGNVTLKWKNYSPDTLTNLQFHTYLNAFKNSQTTFMRESGQNVNLSETEWGWIDVLRMSIKGGEILTQKMTYISPDDANEYDQTVLNIPLDTNILPGAEIEIEMSFLAKLPKIIARTGFERDNYFFVAQWFPKIGVYEPKGWRGAKHGQWNCHQFHANTEFYSNFGVYDVAITVPSDMVVGATGLLQNSSKNNDGTLTYNYRAEDVVDFAWTAWAGFFVKEELWNNVKIKIMLPLVRKNQVNRHISAIKNALDYFTVNLGAYPYPNITVVDPPFFAMNSGGMEYPTLFTTQSFARLPKDIRIPEMVTIHEFGHNYFMGILASNEFEEAFLDEGFNSYFESGIMDMYYGKKKSLVNMFGFGIGDVEMQRAGYVYSDNPGVSAIVRYAWQYPRGAYSMLSYNKPSVALHTLANLVGQETMTEIMKTYFERWKFKHPTLINFIDIVNEVVAKKHGKTFGLNLNWFFEELFYSDHVCDYKLKSINNKVALETNSGIFDSDTNKVYNAYKPLTKKYQTRVIVQRVGDMIFPVELLVTFENGKEELVKWDGFGREQIFYFNTDSKVVKAQVDPYNKVLVDINLLNNGITLKDENKPIWKYTVKFLFWLQNVIQTVSFFA